MQIFMVMYENCCKKFKTYKEAILFSKMINCNFTILVEEFNHDYDSKAVKTDLNINGEELLNVEMYY